MRSYVGDIPVILDLADPAKPTNYQVSATKPFTNKPSLQV
jgi:hypothetical protein